MAIVFLNDKYIEEDRAQISVDDRGLTLGDGIFETLKATEGEIHLFKQHYTRLKKSADYFGFPFQLNQDQIQEICIQLLEKNNLMQKTAALRITLTRGQSHRGIAIDDNAAPTLLITALSFQIPEGSIRLMVSQIKRGSFALTSKHKTLNYLENIMARKAAVEQGFNDALLLNEKDEIVCTSVANIFFVKSEEVFTPALSGGALAGVMRANVIASCIDKKITVHETQISFADIGQFDSCFITNSLIGVRVVASIDAIKFNDKQLRWLT